MSTAEIQNTTGDKVVTGTEMKSGDAERTAVENKADTTTKDGDQEKMQKPPQEKQKQHAGPRMTKIFLKNHCKQNKLYSTPCLNDTLYLHFKGFSTIESLEEYTGLKCLWLESNGLQRIENLDAQTDLRCLFLHQNLIHKLENLEHLDKLCTLNVSNNYIHVIENISCLPVLSTLQIAHNKLETVEDVKHLSQCLAISVLDMSHNLLNDPDIVSVLEAMPELRVLNLTGNKVVRNIPNYRKTLTVRLKQLTFLDERPVFPKDRACAEAWAVGGLEGERKEREQWETREKRKIQDSLDCIAMIRKRAQERHRLLELQKKGENEVPTPSCEENNTQTMTSSQEEKINAFVEDSLDAHEDFLQSQATHVLSEQQTTREHLKAEQQGQGSHREQLGPDAGDQSEIQQLVKKDKEGGNPDQPAIEEELTAAEKIERDQESHQYKQQNQSDGVQFIINQAECVQCEKKHAPMSSPESAPVYCPGPLVTELDDAEQLETIHLSLNHSLCVDDLPDLEDDDTEDFTAVVSSQRVFKPKIEVISGDSDEDEPNSKLSEAIPTVSPDQCLLFSEASNNSTLLYAADLDVLEPRIFQPVRKSKTNQPSSQRCLIEELE